MPSLTNGNGNGATPRPLYWRSEDQLKDSPRFRHWLEHEFPEVDMAEAEAEDGNGEKSNLSVDRRGFLGILGASMALAGFTGCRKPVEKIVPYVNDPEYRVIGMPEYFATAMPRGVNPIGLLAEAHQGRPTKIEGNELHPSSQGGADAYALASVLDLYDPDRSKFPTENGSRRSYTEFVEWYREVYNGHLANRGRGLAILSESFSSPSLYKIREQMKRDLPEAKWVAWEPIYTENRDRGIKQATGEKLRVVHDFSKASVVLSLDSDFIMTEPDAVRHNAEFGRGRKLSGPKDSMNRLYVVESTHSVTGGKADHRLRLQSRQVGAFAVQLALELERQGLTIPGVHVLASRQGADFNREWIRPLAEDLIRNEGKSLVVAGLRQPPAVHALVASINSALGNAGRTVKYRPYEDAVPSDTWGLTDLIEQMNFGDIETLVMFGGNPLWNTPQDLRFADAFKRVKNTIHIGAFVDETARQCSWHVPRSHYLEGWGDVRSASGEATVIQPLIQPLYETHSDLELANLIATGRDQRGYELLRDTWVGSIVGDERGWKVALHDGIVPATDSSNGQTAVIDGGSVADALRGEPLPIDPVGNGQVEVVFAVSNTLHDGSFANNAWLVEMPDPVTKNSWGNAAVMSPASAKKLGVKFGETVTIEVNGKRVTLPAYSLPGHADDSVTLELGWGREQLGRVSETALGQNVYPLRTSTAMGFASGTISPAGGFVDLPNVQDHGSMEGRAIVREGTLDTYQHDPGFAKHMVHIPDLQSLWKEHTYQSGYQWGMAIDLNACTNCNACVIACQSENNIPTVGPDRVRVGREMHWMRMDRYFVGDQQEPRIANQPMLCQHCEMAPCEQVCPVNATSHDSEGLNVMTYNRCIGTRYCSNNCPYKVRRFNFFNYTNKYPDTIKMLQNPDVTVRSRGVMEKCTFCLQRINLAKQRAKADGREVKDADLQTACQQACPPNAIVFGNINDPNSEVSKLNRNKRAYGVLEQFNTRPRVQYLAGILNPNPKMPDQPAVEVEAAAHGAEKSDPHGGMQIRDSH